MSGDTPAAAPIAVYIVEDEPQLRQEFASVVSASPTLQLVGATGSAQAARRELQRMAALDVLLLDLGLPDGDGSSLIPHLRQHHPLAKALVISVFAGDQRVLGALSAGAQGYLLKDTGAEALVRAIIDVAQGDAPLSPRIARHLLRGFAAAPMPALASGKHECSKLTSREAELLTRASQGHLASELAASLGLSLHTINTHLRNCYAKLGVRNRLQAVKKARDSGQIP